MCVSFHACLCVYIYILCVYYLHSQEAHINSCYKHFYYFVTEFKLVETKEFEPLVSGAIGGGCHGFRCVSFVAVSTQYYNDGSSLAIKFQKLGT